jgi:hypothetical protein
MMPHQPIVVRSAAKLSLGVIFSDVMRLAMRDGTKKILNTELTMTLLREGKLLPKRQLAARVLRPLSQMDRGVV